MHLFTFHLTLHGPIQCRATARANPYPEPVHLEEIAYAWLAAPSNTLTTAWPIAARHCDVTRGTVVGFQPERFGGLLTFAQDPARPRVQVKSRKLNLALRDLLEKLTASTGITKETDVTPSQTRKSIVAWGARENCGTVKCYLGVLYAAFLAKPDRARAIAARRLPACPAEDPLHGKRRGRPEGCPRRFVF